MRINKVIPENTRTSRDISTYPWGQDSRWMIMIRLLVELESTGNAVGLGIG